MSKLPKGLIEAIRAKTGEAPRTLSRRFSAKNKEYGGLLTQAQATALYAASTGVKIRQYFPPDFCDDLTGLRPTGAPIVRGAPTAPVEAVATVRIGDSLPANIPFVTSATLNEARRMAGVYPMFYLFENSARALVLERMSAELGSDWWSVPERVPADVKREVRKRMQAEGAARWIDPRGAHEIYYSDMNDLPRIITLGANWQLFQDIFGEQFRVRSIFHEMEALRNVVAHNNGLSKQDVDRLRSNFKTWTRQARPPTGEGGKSASEPDARPSRLPS